MYLEWSNFILNFFKIDKLFFSQRKSFSFPGHSHQEVYALLQFIYSGKLDIEDQSIPKLFETAKKYEIQGLKVDD
jgi:hypothetical protein